MTDRLLTTEEQNRFVVYCQQEADSYREMAKTMEDNGIPDVLVKRQKQYAAAYAIVATHLASMEPFTVGGRG